MFTIDSIPVTYHEHSSCWRANRRTTVFRDFKHCNEPCIIHLMTTHKGTFVFWEYQLSWALCQLFHRLFDVPFQPSSNVGSCGPSSAASEQLTKSFQMHMKTTNGIVSELKNYCRNILPSYHATHEPSSMISNKNAMLTSHCVRGLLRSQSEKFSINFHNWFHAGWSSCCNHTVQNPDYYLAPVTWLEYHSRGWLSLWDKEQWYTIWYLNLKWLVQALPSDYNW